MKYVLNKGRYALSFTVIKNGLDFKIAFDKRRFYLDTGNLATSGITEVTDEDFAELKKNEDFKRLLGNGTFEEVDGYKTSTISDEVVKAKDAEIAELKKQLKTKGASKKEIEDKDIEIKNLKASLEALKVKDKEAEGF